MIYSYHVIDERNGSVEFPIGALAELNDGILLGHLQIVEKRQAENGQLRVILQID